MVGTTHHVTIEPNGPYQLSSTIEFLNAFRPAALTTAVDDPVLRFAFVVDGTEEVAGVDIRQAVADGPVRVGVTTAAPVEGVKRQVTRLLSIDHDGSGYAAVGKRDPVIGRLQAASPGFRPTGFWSPYEAAVWAITSHRIQIAQVATVKAAIATLFGTIVLHDGRDLTAFPSPAALAAADLSTVPGLGGRKPEWLHGIAIAAMEGELDADQLRARPPDEAMAGLQRLAGVGPFSAELILLRGAMTVDVPSGDERRHAGALAAAYGLSEPIDGGTVARITAGWAPYRTWATVLIRAAGESSTG